MDSLDLKNPVNIVKLHQAAKVLSYMLDDHTVKEACALAGVSYQTHLLWVENGVYAALTGKELQEISQMSTHGIVSRWGDVMQRLLDIALGKVPGAGPRESLGAIKLINDMIIEPMAHATPKGKAAEEAYLEAQQGFGWTPVLQGGKVVAATQTVTKFEFHTGDDPSDVDVLEAEIEEIEGDV